MVDNDKFLVLDGVHDLLDIGGGELLAQIRGEEAGGGLGDDHAVSAHGLVGLDVGQDELRGLLQGGVDHLRLQSSSS